MKKDVSSSGAGAFFLRKCKFAVDQMQVATSEKQRQKPIPPNTGVCSKKTATETESGEYQKLIYFLCCF